MSLKHPQKISASAYLVMEPIIYGSGDSRYVHHIRVDRIRMEKPSLKRGEIVVRLKLNFDEASLIESIPVAEMNVLGFSVSPPEPEQVEAGPAFDA